MSSRDTDVCWPDHHPCTVKRSVSHHTVARQQHQLSIDQAATTHTSLYDCKRTKNANWLRVGLSRLALLGASQAPSWSAMLSKAQCAVGLLESTPTTSPAL